MNAPTLLIGSAIYGRPRRYQGVRRVGAPKHAAGCGCRRSPVDPWPGAPLRQPTWTTFTRPLPTIGDPR